MAENQKAENILQTLLKVIATLPNAHLSDWKDVIESGLPCPTCGGSKIKPRKYDMCDPDDEPCPDCADKPYICKHCGKTFPKFMGEEFRGHVSACRVGACKVSLDEYLIYEDEPESQEPAKPVSEFVKKIENLANKLSDKPTAAETKKFLIALVDMLFELCDRLEAAKEENNKLNLILYHRENGLSHPVLQQEIDKSELVELQERNDNQCEQIVKFIKENGELTAKFEAAEAENLIWRNNAEGECESCAITQELQAELEVSNERLAELESVFLVGDKILRETKAKLEAAEQENEMFWEDLLRKLQDIWPDKKLIYGLSPLELIADLAEERDQLQAKLEALKE